MKAINYALKDDLPECTVERIRKIFVELGIEFEEVWLEAMPNVFSLNLKIKGTYIYSNGKGVTKAFALASAYGEMIERLQNLLYFRLSDSFAYLFDSEDNKLYYDDVVSSKRDIVEFERWKKSTFTADGVMKEFNTKWETLESCYRKTFGRFNSESNVESLLIPYYCIDYFYGSNGMAAGNTLNEAMVQALSEIIERNAVSRILNTLDGEPYDNITELLVHQDEKIKCFRECLLQNGYTLNLLDISEDDLPSIMAVFFDIKNRQYFINVASHPNIITCAERTVTEFLQGRELNKIDDMQSVYKSYKAINSRANRTQIFIDGAGVFPIKCLDTTKTVHHLGDTWSLKNQSNSDVISRYAEIFRKRNLDIYTKNCSYLGFPTVHVIIPGFSEVVDLKELSNFELLINATNAKTSYNEIVYGNVSDFHVQRLMDYWDDPRIRNGKSLRDLYNISIIEDEDLLSGVTKEMILTILYLYKKEFKAAHESCVKYCEFIDKNTDEIQIREYYDTVCTYLYFKSEGYADNDIVNIINELMPDSSLLTTVIDDLKDQNLFVNLPQIGNCKSSGNGEKSSSFEHEKTVFDKLLKLSCENPVNEISEKSYCC